MTALHNLINAAVLIYGGIRDYRDRVIPNLVPAVLLLTGLLFGGQLLLQTGAMFLTAAVFLLLDRLTDGGSPGGDFKLMCALAFSGSVPVYLSTLLLASLSAMLVSAIRKTGLKGHLPWCSFIAPGYLLSAPAIYLILYSTGGFAQ